MHSSSSSSGMKPSCSDCSRRDGSLLSQPCRPSMQASIPSVGLLMTMWVGQVALQRASPHSPSQLSLMHATRLLHTPSLSCLHQTLIHIHQTLCPAHLHLSECINRRLQRMSLAPSADMLASRCPGWLCLRLRATHSLVNMLLQNLLAVVVSSLHLKVGLLQSFA